MATGLIAKVAATIERYGMLGSRPDGMRVLVAVSGGPDSVALFWSLRELSGELAYRLAVAHLDHGSRGAEGAADRSFVEDMARRAAVPCLTEKVDITKEGGNWEDRARRQRYSFLRKAAAIMGCERIAVAHTLEDQAETVLMRILAGTGRSGLACMRPVSGKLVRPLIECTRQEVWHFLHAGAYGWRHDLTNYDVARTRNRVRHLAMPFLEGMFNRRLARALATLAELAAGDEEVLERLCLEAAGQVRTAGDRLKVESLLELPMALRRRLVRRWVASLGARRPTAEQIERVLELAARGGPAGSVTIGGLEVCYELGLLSATSAGERLRGQVSYDYRLRPGSEVVVEEAAVAISLSGRMRVDEAPAPGADVCVADASLLESSLRVRNRRRGDRLCPIGMSGSKELKEVFREARLQRAQRVVAPIVCRGREILWIPGVARSRVALVTPSTRWVVVLRRRQH